MCLFSTLLFETFHVLQHVTSGGKQIVDLLAMGHGMKHYEMCFWILMLPGTSCPLPIPLAEWPPWRHREGSPRSVDEWLESIDIDGTAAPDLMTVTIPDQFALAHLRIGLDFFPHSSLITQLSHLIHSTSRPFNPQHI